MLLLTGHEPDAAWQRFADAATELAVELGARMVVGLGAYPFASPHTRPSTARRPAPPTPQLVSAVGYLRNSVDVPAGMEAVLEHTLREEGRAGARAVGAGAALRGDDVVSRRRPWRCSTACQNVAGVDVERFGGAQRGADPRSRLDELVAGNEEHQTMVDQLERAYDARRRAPPADRRTLRRSIRTRCRRATSWPPSSSATSATKASEAAAERGTFPAHEG